MEGVLVMGIWAERNSKGSLLPKVESHQFDAKVYANRINDQVQRLMHLRQ